MKFTEKRWNQFEEFHKFAGCQPSIEDCELCYVHSVVDFLLSNQRKEIILATSQETRMKAEKKLSKKKIKASRSKQINKRKTPGTWSRGPSTNKYR